MPKSGGLLNGLFVVAAIAVASSGCRERSDENSAAARDSESGGTAGHGTDGDSGIFDYVADGSCQPLIPDLDGDGVGAGAPKCRSWSANGTPLPAGFALESGDCNDSDPSVHHVAYRDADKDGFGAPSDPLCVGDALPADGTVQSGDCDDHDPAVNPSAPEQWFDSVDSNCDGNVDPVDCETPNPCACMAANGEPAAVPVNAKCQSADLTLSNSINCPACTATQPVYVVVENRGTIEATSIAVARTLNGQPLPAIPLPEGMLQPGHSSRLVNVGSAPGNLELRVTSGVEDCDSTNDTATVSVAVTDCK